MKFRPCIDIRNGKVTQIVGSTIDNNLQENFTSDQDASFFAKLYKKDELYGGHLIMLDQNEKTKQQALLALKSFPKGLQVGGEINPTNAKDYLDQGAQKVIVSSYVFTDGNLNFDKLKSLSDSIGKENLVLDLSCRKKDNSYYVVINRWQTFTTTKISTETFKKLENYCSELLIHGVDQEGKKQGIDKELLKLLTTSRLKITYAGGISSMEDIELIQEIGKGKIDFTVGSALNIFGGNLKYREICDAQIKRPLRGACTELAECSRGDNGVATRIIPCLDVKNGRVVKGINFVNFRDAGDPVKLGKFYSDEGADELIFLDITATYEERNTFVEIVKNIAQEVNIPFTVGGGIKTIRDIETMLNNGADKVSLGSAAIKTPDLIDEASDRFGAQCIVISVDAKRNIDLNKWEIYIKGGRENTYIDAVEFSKDMELRGAGELLVNSLDRDGTGDGFDTDLLREITQAVNIPVIASSGAGKESDFIDAVTKGGASAVLAATLFHYKKVKIPSLKKYLSKNGLRIRPTVISTE